MRPPDRSLPGITYVATITAKRWQPGAQMSYAPFLCFGVITALLYNPVTTIFRLHSVL